MKGLKGLKYFDNVDGIDNKLESEEAIGIIGETDRIYKGAGDTITVHSRSRDRKGQASVVVVQHYYHTRIFPFLSASTNPQTVRKGFCLLDEAVSAEV